MITSPIRTKYDIKSRPREELSISVCQEIRHFNTVNASVHEFIFVVLHIWREFTMRAARVGAQTNDWIKIIFFDSADIYFSDQVVYFCYLLQLVVYALAFWYSFVYLAPQLLAPLRRYAMGI